MTPTPQALGLGPAPVRGTGAQVRAWARKHRVISDAQLQGYPLTTSTALRVRLLDEHGAVIEWQDFVDHDEARAYIDRFLSASLRDSDETGAGLAGSPVTFTVGREGVAASWPLSIEVTVVPCPPTCLVCRCEQRHEDGCPVDALEKSRP